MHGRAHRVISLDDERARRGLPRRDGRVVELHRPMATPQAEIARRRRLVAEVRFWTIETLAILLVVAILWALALPVLL